MFIKRQELLFLKKENLKITENFGKFWKEHEANKKFISKNHIKDFMEEQNTLIHAINQHIDEIIASNSEDQQKDVKESLKVNLNKKSNKIIATRKIQQKQNSLTLPQKRTRSLTVGEATRASKKSHKDPVKTYLEKVLEIPGLQHLAENIFLNLNFKDIISCLQINQSSKSFLDNPSFWIKKFIQRGLSKQNQLDWMSAIQITKNTRFERNISFYLRKILKKEKLKDLPCFINASVIENFRTKCGLVHFSGDDDDEIKAGRVQVLAPTTNDNLNNDGSYEFASAVIVTAVNKGHLKQIQAMIPFLDDPNAQFQCNSLYYVTTDRRRWELTPFGTASARGHLEIVKFLVPFANNLNATTLQYSIQIARSENQHHVVKYLQSIAHEISIN